MSRSDRSVGTTPAAPSWRWWLLLAPVLAASGLVAVLPTHQSRWLYHGAEVVWVAGMIAGIRIYKPTRARIMWLLVTAAFASAVTGGILEWQGFGLVASVCYVLSYVLGVVAYVILICVRTGRRDPTALLDACILLTAAGMATWVGLVHPVLARDGLTADTALMLIYPSLDLFLLFLVLRLVLAPGSKVVALRLVVVGMSFTLAADVLYLAGGGTATSLMRALYMTAVGLVACAALHPSMVAIAEPGVPARTARPRVLRFVILGAAAAAGPLGLIWAALDGRVDLLRPLAVATLLLLAFVFVRMGHAVLEAERARRRSAALHAQVQASEHRFRSLVQSAAEGVVVVNADGEVTYVSPAVEKVTGFTPEQLRGADGFSFIPPEELARAGELFGLALGTPGEHFSAEISAIHADGDPRTLLVTLTNLLDDDAVGGLVANFRDISESKALSDELHRQAFYDRLTGLANRALLWDRMDQALHHCRSRSGLAALLLVDVDDFKYINDTHGHDCGDAVLTEIGRRLGDCVRGGDTAARMGGDEFAVLLADVDREQDAIDVAGRLVATLLGPINVDGVEVTADVSIGVAITCGADSDAESWMHRADLAMYDAKRDGDADFAVYEEAMEEAAASRTVLRRELALALERSELLCHYQPIVEVDSGRILGVEALVRWQHPERGLVPPNDFIPVAEESGLIRPLGQWVLDTACAQLARWIAVLDGRPLTMHVNVSTQQLVDPAFAGVVAAAITRHRIPAGALSLEITETGLMESGEAMIARLSELKALGVELAIDDFGTGYSSLRYLQQFPVDVLKIDRGFVGGLTEGPESAAVAHAIIKLAHILRLKTVAEGVETASQRDRLIELGCDRAQGYLYSRPLPAEDVTVQLHTCGGFPEAQPASSAGAIVSG